jgi:RNA polymerase sigma factor (sigma-70 family)
MAKQPLNGVLQHIRKMAAVQTYRESSDRNLLERFVGERDEAAFTVLIERHGPMVLGVCRRTLPNFHDAEDACQATFLVLARTAASVRKKASLSSWLHGVARRVAAKLKRGHARRKAREQGFDSPAPRDPAAEVSWREVQAILDEELQRLPERYRAPVVLCYLECMTRDEAAKQLGLLPTTLYGRLERARDMLRTCLAKRGLTLSAAISAAAVGEGAAQAALAPTFVVSSTKAATLLAAGQASECPPAEPPRSHRRPWARAFGFVGRNLSRNPASNSGRECTS